MYSYLSYSIVYITYVIYIKYQNKLILICNNAYAFLGEVYKIEIIN